jgi:hypothetical protein
MAARLKVYRTPLGFFDAVVAAPNQAAALKAFDVRENLFASGMASVTDDPVAVEAALARPGVVLRRPAGGGGAFRETPDLPEAPAAPPRPRTKPAAKAPPRPAPEPPDRSKLDAAEAALAGFEAAAAARCAVVAERRAALEAEARDLSARLDAERRRLQDRVARERESWRRAGGT